MRFSPLPKQLLRAATSSLRHARLEDTRPVENRSTELDDFCVVEDFDLNGFCGIIELRYEAEVCLRRSRRPTWASNLVLTRRLTLPSTDQATFNRDASHTPPIFQILVFPTPSEQLRSECRPQRRASWLHDRTLSDFYVVPSLDRHQTARKCKPHPTSDLHDHHEHPRSGGG